LQLSEPIPAALAAPFKIQSFSGLGREVSVVSYAQGRSKALSWQKNCGVIGRQGGLIAFSCDVHFGSSGAPVFDRSDGRARIISIISSGSRDDNGTVSLGMELSRLVPELFAALRSGRGVFPTISINAKRLRVGSDARTSGARFLRP
jgi:protease YdgD